MSWIIVMLLVLIIILLSICIYLDIRFTDIFESRVPTSTVATVTTIAPSSSSTQAPTTTQQPRVTTAKPLITTKPTETTAKPLITTKPTTTAKPLVTTTPDAITTAPLTTTKAPIPTQQTPITTAPITTTPITTTPITTPAVTSSSAKPDETTVPVFPNAPTICIDPGHGFSDPGALGVLNGVTYQEDDINLAIAYKLKNELNARGFNVIFTHDGVNLPEDKYLKKAEGSTFFYVNNRNAWITDHELGVVPGFCL
jgi:N-acetylmuramoyl-L-alanine amidase